MTGPNADLVEQDPIHHKVIDELWNRIANADDFDPFRAWIPVAIGVFPADQDPRDTTGDVAIRHAVFGRLDYNFGHPQVTSTTPPPSMTKEELEAEHDQTTLQDRLQDLEDTLAAFQAQRKLELNGGCDNDEDIIGSGYDIECSSAKN